MILQSNFFRLGGLAMVFFLALSVLARESEFDPEGYLYGEVTLENGKTHRGILRWGTEEAFWGDIFNSIKPPPPHLEYIPEEKLLNKKETKLLGFTLKTSWEKSRFSRQFMARFGDIAALEDFRSRGVTVVMKSGERYEVRGYSNDVSADIFVWDADLGKIELEWKRLERIQFMAAPKNIVAPDSRLQGTVETEIGIFKGYIQWDLQEALGGDRLDGDTDDGRLKIEMRRIQSIERRSRRSSLVTLRDGRELILSGTNDVNDENRGICVEDVRYGRVQIPWQRFTRATFEEVDGTGPEYGDFKAGSALRGKLTDRDGNTYQGQIIYDMDESRTWELLNGNVDDVEYSIPMGLIAALEPRGQSATNLRLKNGESLVLDGAADVNQENFGVLVIPDSKEKPSYIPWDQIKRLEFE